jgi:hypothetical protein
MPGEEHFKGLRQGAAAGKDWRENSRPLTGFCAIARALRRVPRHNFNTDSGYPTITPGASSGHALEVRSNAEISYRPQRSCLLFGRGFSE